MSPVGEEPTFLWEGRESQEDQLGRTWKVRGVYLLLWPFYNFIILSVKHEWNIQGKLHSRRHAVLLPGFKEKSLKFLVGWIIQRRLLHFSAIWKVFPVNPLPLFKTRHMTSFFLKQSHVSLTEKYQSIKFTLITAYASHLLETHECCNTAKFCQSPPTYHWASFMAPEILR